MSTRTRPHEHGFTLIELLVVMVIVSILMAVAIPTFMGQKKNADRTRITKMVRHVAEVVEACAGSKNMDGTYTGCADEYLAYEYEVSYKNNTNAKSNSWFDPNDPTGSFIEISGYGLDGSVNDGTDRMTPQAGYAVSGWTIDGGKRVSFNYNRMADGSVSRTCSKNKRMCAKGTW